LIPGLFLIIPAPVIPLSRHLAFIIPYFSLFVMFIILVLFCIIILRYPEGFLVFDNHILRARKAYYMIKAKEKILTEQVPNLSHSAIGEYLTKIPPEFFERDSPALLEQDSAKLS
jgi:hypothetical protein